MEGAGESSEAAIEGLNPWTQYQLQIQAYNFIGPGPWSSTIAAHTAESGTNRDVVYSCFLFAGVRSSLTAVILAGPKKTDGLGVKCSDYLAQSLFIVSPFSDLYALPRFQRGED